MTKVTSMQKVKVRGQRSRSQRSQPDLTVSLRFALLVDYDQILIAFWLWLSQSLWNLT